MSILNLITKYEEIFRANPEQESDDPIIISAGELKAICGAFRSLETINEAHRQVLEASAETPISPVAAGPSC